MLGNPAVSVLVDAYNKGIRNWNVTLGYQYCKNSVDKFGNQPLGYSPRDISRTLEYAYTDWCMGYDPVIPIDWSDPKRQMSDILTHIADYQSLVDRNYSFALNNASWASRMPYIYNCLKNSGYSLPSLECRSEDKNRS